VTNGNRIGWDSLDAVRRLTASYGISPFSFSVGERKIMNHFVVNVVSGGQKKRFDSESRDALNFRFVAACSSGEIVVLHGDPCESRV
jgi:hypothetical protein